jgi:hypothetical protein
MAARTEGPAWVTVAAEAVLGPVVARQQPVADRPLQTDDCTRSCVRRTAPAFIAAAGSKRGSTRASGQLQRRVECTMALPRPSFALKATIGMLAFALAPCYCLLALADAKKKNVGPNQAYLERHLKVDLPFVTRAPRERE